MNAKRLCLFAGMDSQYTDGFVHIIYWRMGMRFTALMIT